MSKSNLVSYQTTKTTLLYLHSGCPSQYNNGSNKSSVVFFFKDGLKVDKSTIEMRVSVKDAIIPISFYQINATNNKLTITVSGVPTTYYSPYGNYSVTSFIAQWATTVGAAWVVTFNSISNQFTFSYTSNFTISDDTNSLFPVIGFATGSQYSSIARTLTAPYPVNFSGLNRLIISSPSFNTENISCYAEGYNRSLASVPVNNTNSSVIYYSNVTNHRNTFYQHNVNQVQIDIYDDFQNLVNFNNIDWSMTLQIDTVSESIKDLGTLKEVYENEIIGEF